MNKTVYILIDCSGSMYGSRADAVNNAMEKIVTEGIPQIKQMETADLNLSFVVLGFSDNFPNKVIEFVPKTSLEDFNAWNRIEQDMFEGGTPTGAAIKAVIDDLQGGNRGDVDLNSAAPAILLISDGLPNGNNPTYEEVLACADKDSPTHVKAFRKALRVALAINVDEEGRESLKKFGSVSKKMEAAGLAGYYECTDEYLDQFVEVIKSATINASVAS